ncbi:DUF1015 domain-containing protein [Flindersiella endophytica]
MAEAAGGGLVLEPFRGIRYGPDHAGRLADVTSPPYDVVDGQALLELRESDPHNVVRLILPSSGEPAEAARLLREWRAGGVLVRDDTAMLYGYEQRISGRPIQRGLLGAVRLHPERDGVILPHEDVMPGPVAGRLAIMRACDGNLEPILLSYEGGGAASEIVEATSAAPALATAVVPDGLEHRLWPIQDPRLLAAIAGDLASRQALIADGHHRYAAYLGLRAEHRAAGDGDGPWDYGLALLVDQRAHPLQLAAIHRVVTGLSLAEASQRLANANGFVVESFGRSAEAARSVLAELGGAPAEPVADRLGPDPVAVAGDSAGRAGRVRRHAYVLTDGQQWVVLSAPWASFDLHPMLDSTVLHEVVLSQVLGVSEDQIRYAHAADSAISDAGPQSVAILLNPVDIGTVADLARRGIRMPRKSTSFGPKPRTGLVMRSFIE